MGIQSQIARLARALREFVRILWLRLRTQGLRTTLRWLYSVGAAKITGRLSLRYSQVAPNLYVGAQYGRRGMLALQRARINATVSLREEFSDEKHGLALAEHSYLPVVDNTAPTIAQLDEGVAFIQRIIAAGGNVYVHCGSGVGRAPSLAAAYLIAEGATLDDAVATIQKARPFIRILPVQLERLREYEIHRMVRPAPEPALRPLETLPEVNVEGHIEDVHKQPDPGAEAGQARPDTAAPTETTPSG